MTDHRVIVTGGSGFVGTNLIEHFLNQGWEIRNFDIAQPRNPDHLCYWKNLDILDKKKLVEETRQFQASVFLHFAARTDLNEKQNITGYAANIEGVRNVIEAIRSTPTIQRVVYASSQLVCKLGYRPRNDGDYRPSTLYGYSKVLTERIIRSAEDLGACWTILRPTSLWGPWFGEPYKNLFTTIARDLYTHPGNCYTLKQWGYIGNSVYQIHRLIEASVEKVHKKTFYLADYQPIALRDYTNKVQATLMAKPIRTIPVELLKAAAFMGDIAKKLGWINPPLTTFRLHNIITDEIQNLDPMEEITGRLPFSVEQGIEMTVRWLKGHDKTIPFH